MSYQADAVSYSSTSWTITTPSLTLAWEMSSSGEIRLNSLQSPGNEWMSSPCPMFTRGNHHLSNVTLEDVTATKDADSLRFAGQLAPSGLTATINWTVYQEDSVVVSEIEVENETGATIDVESLSSLHLAIPMSVGSVISVLAGGKWDEALPPRGYQLQERSLRELPRHLTFGSAMDGRSSGEFLPWFSLSNSGGGILTGLVWSGRWALDITRGDGALDLAFGISDFQHALAPGERLALPSVVMADYEGTLDDGANTWRQWITDHWMPELPDDWPWIQYNHWYAYYGDIDEPRLLTEARLAAEAGCEVFVIDDGWFRGRRPDSYSAGWGDWVEERGKFPTGLKAFGDTIRSLGMKFGLWVEPERADHEGELVARHPDWLASRNCVPISRTDPAGRTEGVHLCLGNPAVRDWMAHEIIRVVQEYGVDWLKWDYNIGYGLGCNAEDHGHQAGDGHFAHTRGLYAVLEQLRDACPDLVIENCASGGHRVDLGTLQHTHTNWLSDYTHRAASCRQHAQGGGLFLPLPHLNTWVLEERSQAAFRSRMGGAFGVSSFLGTRSENELQLLNHSIQEYKRLRPLLHGSVYLLTSPLHQEWDVWQFRGNSSQGSAILAFRERGRLSEVRVHPVEIQKDLNYSVERTSDNATIEIPGSDLIADGLTIQLAQEESEILWITSSC